MFLVTKRRRRVAPSIIQTLRSSLREAQFSEPVPRHRRVVSDASFDKFANGGTARQLGNSLPAPCLCNVNPTCILGSLKERLRRRFHFWVVAPGKSGFFSDSARISKYLGHLYYNSFLSTIFFFLLVCFFFY